MGTGLMRALILLTILAIGSTALVFGQGTAPASAGDPSITATRAIGEVKTIDVAGKQLTLKNDAGSAVTIVLSDGTSLMRLPPGETTMGKATKIALTDIGEGDRGLAVGKNADDHKSGTARSLGGMNKADIAKKQEQERMEWRRRGILGVIAAVKPDAKEITITTTTRTPAGPQQQPVIIPVSDQVDLKRYAPDSIKFSDAKTSKFSD